MNKGYIKLYRKSLDNGLLKNHKAWVFFSYCLLKATHKEFKAIVGHQEVLLYPGQLIFGRRVASEETGLTQQEIRTALQFLRNLKILTSKSTNKFSIITIINWDAYQVIDQGDNQHINQRLTSKQPHTRTKEHNNNIYSSIPFTEIQEKYHEILPELPGIQKWTPARKTALKARWESGIKNKNDTPINTIQYWDELFHYIRDSGLLMGKNNRGWKANVDFIIKETSFLKIIEGQYHK